jgi:hypothetical protein
VSAWSIHQIGEHPPDRVVPAGIDRAAVAPQRPGFGQPRLAGLPVGRLLVPHRPGSDPQLGGLRSVAGLQRLPGRELRARLTRSRRVRVTGPVAGEDLPHVRGPLSHLRSLSGGQPGQRRASRHTAGNAGLCIRRPRMGHQGTQPHRGELAGPLVAHRHPQQHPARRRAEAVSYQNFARETRAKST